ncbi:hypothetical protein OF83DRAFT_1179370 [Amylostereum chailletii]|nr:hypothetical protein OF83DRAFT_1179370 [Amylostereum chailletii]
MDDYKNPVNGFCYGFDRYINALSNYLELRNKNLLISRAPNYCLVSWSRR